MKKMLYKFSIVIQQLSYTNQPFVTIFSFDTNLKVILVYMLFIIDS